MGSLYINNGQAGTDVTGDGIILKDMDDDGIDDYVFCDENGVLTLYINQGPSNNGWGWIPASSAPVASGVGAKREQVRLAYIFGHSRADYGECFFGKSYLRNFFSQDSAQDMAGVGFGIRREQRMIITIK